MSIEKFQNPYRFEDFKQLASDASLSKYEKIGFPDGSVHLAVQLDD